MVVRIVDKYKNLIRNVIVTIVSFFVTWVVLLLVNLFLFAPSRLNSQLKDIYASVRNQIVDAKSVSHAKKTEIKKNIKGVSLDVLDEDTKYARDLFKQYLSVNSSKEYTDVKKHVTNKFTSDSSFVKMFFIGDTFKDKLSFESLDVIASKWSEDGSVVYNGILTYKVNGKKSIRLITFTMFYTSDKHTNRGIKDLVVIDTDFA